MYVGQLGTQLCILKHECLCSRLGAFAAQIPDAAYGAAQVAFALAHVAAQIAYVMWSETPHSGPQAALGRKPQRVLVLLYTTLEARLRDGHLKCLRTCDT